MRKTRASYVMVPEDDPQWVRFWNAYPRRVSKKDARKVWATLNPAPSLVGKMIAALEWQIPLNRWDGDKLEFAPYPASWLNAARWDDEPPKAIWRPALEWACPHLERCANRHMCEQSTILGRPLRPDTVAS